MAKSISRTGRFPKTLALVAAIVFLVFGVFYALEKFNITQLTPVSGGSTSESEGGTSGPTKEEKAMQAAADAEQKKSYLDNASSGNNDTKPSDTTSQAVSLSLSANQDGNTITVLTQIQNISEGSCSLTITNGSKSNSQTAQIIYQPQFSSCAGFSVAKNTLSSGTWTISITVTPLSGDILTKSTTLEVI